MIFFKSNTKPLIFYLAILNIIIIAVILKSLNKGFDITDEGGFLLSYQNVDIYRGGIYNYHIIINKLTRFLNPGIIEYRFITLILTMISSLVLSFGFYKWGRFKYSKTNIYLSFIFIFSFISIGNFLIYFSGLQTIHNNTLTNFILQVNTGLILFLLSFHPKGLVKSKINILILLIIGILCAFSFFIKFSTGIIQVVVYQIFIYIYFKKRPSNNKYFLSSILLVGFFIGLLLYFSFFQRFNEWRFNFRNEYLMLPDHSPLMLLNTYINDILYFFKFFLKYFSWLLFFPAINIANKLYPNYFNFLYRKPFFNIFLIISFIIFSYEIYYFNFYRSTFATSPWINSYFYIIIICFIFLLLFSFLYNDKLLTKINYFHEILILLILAITPFIGAIGTANPIFLNVLSHAAPWFCIILVLFFYISKYIDNKIILSLFIIFPATITASQIIDGNIFKPYFSIFNFNKSNYFDQNQEVRELPRLKNINIDIKTKKFLLELNHIFKKNNFKNQYPIFGFHLPGIVYLLGGTSPGMPYYFNAKRDNNAFKAYKDINKLPVFLITEDNPINSELLMIMKNKGINFPENFSYKGEVYFPYRNVNLKVFFPKSGL